MYYLLIGRLGFINPRILIVTLSRNWSSTWRVKVKVSSKVGHKTFVKCVMELPYFLYPIPFRSGKFWVMMMEHLLVRNSLCNSFSLAHVGPISRGIVSTDCKPLSFLEFSPMWTNDNIVAQEVAN